MLRATWQFTLCWRSKSWPGLGINSRAWHSFLYNIYNFLPAIHTQGLMCIIVVMEHQTFISFPMFFFFHYCCCSIRQAAEQKNMLNKDIFSNCLVLNNFHSWKVFLWEILGCFFREMFGYTFNLLYESSGLGHGDYFFRKIDRSWRNMEMHKWKWMLLGALGCTNNGI